MLILSALAALCASVPLEPGTKAVAPAIKNSPIVVIAEQVEDLDTAESAHHRGRGHHHHRGHGGGGYGGYGGGFRGPVYPAHGGGYGGGYGGGVGLGVGVGIGVGVGVGVGGGYGRK